MARTDISTSIQNQQVAAVIHTNSYNISRIGLNILIPIFFYNGIVPCVSKYGNQNNYISV